MAAPMKWRLLFLLIFIVISVFVFNKVIVRHYMSDVWRAKILRFETSCFLEFCYSLISLYVWCNLSKFLDRPTEIENWPNIRNIFSLKSDSTESRLWKYCLILILVSSSCIYPTFSFFISTDTFLISFWIGVCLAYKVQLFTGTVIVKIVSFIVRLSRANRLSYSALSKLKLVVILYATVCTLWGFLNAIQPPAITNALIPIKNLPSHLNGLSITLVTDVHLGPTTGKQHLEKIVHTVNYLQSDLVIIGGDLVDGRVNQLVGSTEPLEWLSPKYGTYFVTGNHEYYTTDVHNWFIDLESRGVKILHNSHVWLPSDTDKSLCLAGVDDPQGESFKVSMEIPEEIVSVEIPEGDVDQPDIVSVEIPEVRSKESDDVTISLPVTAPVQMKLVSPLGSSQPNKKSNTSPSDSRLFQSARYESRFVWVYYSQSKHGYMCKLCELFSLCDDKTTPYVSCGAILGTHPSRRLEIHENSGAHKTAASLYSKSTSKTIPELLSQKHKPSGEEKVERNRRYVKKLFQTCLFLCEKKWAQSNLEDLVKFLGSTGDPDIKSVLDEDSITYLSSTSVSDILKVLSNYFEKKTLEQLREEKFTLLADESTDHSNRTQLSVFVRWVTPHGPREEYMGLIHVAKTTSEALMEAIEMFFMGKMIPLQNIRFVGLDGCNTMSGCNKGLQRRIRNGSPLSIYINCRNHKLALCSVHLLKTNAILTDVDTLLLAIWKMFHFSPKKAAVFESFQEVYGQRPIKIVKAATTRWLSHLHACVRFTARYETLVDTMDSLIESTHEPEIRGIRSGMTKKQNVAMILVLTDVLKPINFLSLYLQEDCGVFSELPTRVKQCRDDLEAIIHQYQEGNYEGLEYSKCEDLFFIIDERTVFARRNRGHAAEVTPAGFLRVHGIPLIYGLIGEVEDAFTSKDAVLDAFSVLHPSNLPEDIADITAYGEASARVLSDFYGSERVDVFEGHRTVVPPELGSSAVIYAQLLDFRRQLFMYKFMDHAMDIDKALTPCGDAQPNILISHRPDGAKKALDSKHRVDLVLSGHTHGGQMFPITVGAYLFNPYYAGLYKHGENSHVYVSMGTRFWGFPVRIGTRSEITKIILKSV